MGGLFASAALPCEAWLTNRHQKSCPRQNPARRQFTDLPLESGSPVLFCDTGVLIR